MDKIGFIGLGIMGRPMATNLLKAGFDVTVHNRSQAPVDALAAIGAHPATSPRDVAEQSDVTISILPNAATVEQVLAGENGVFAAGRSNQVIIDMSTISPLAVKPLAEKAAQLGSFMLDAPVSGGDRGAIEGTLSIMVGGDEAAFDRCLPIFRAMGKTVIRVGDSGAGQIVKACNQIVVAVNLMALSEALVLGSKAGVDPAKIIEILGGGLANSRVLELRGQKMLQHDFTPGGKVAFHNKDMGIVNEVARSLGVPLLAAPLVSQIFTALQQAGYSDLDHSAILLFFEQLAQHKLIDD